MFGNKQIFYLGASKQTELTSTGLSAPDIYLKDCKLNPSLKAQGTNKSGIGSYHWHLYEVKHETNAIIWKIYNT